MAVMKVRWWKLDDKVGQISVDPEVAVEAWRMKEASFWTDVEADEILEHKGALRRLDTVVDEHRALFDLLSMVHEPYLDLRSLGETFELVSRTTSFADRTVDRLEKHLTDLQQRHDANQQEKTNKRLAVLTVISAIFLPLTLLA